ncbi:MAG: hypothetical protein R2795_13890 [Saprospiraceae bacterium]
MALRICRSMRTSGQATEQQPTGVDWPVLPMFRTQCLTRFIRWLLPNTAPAITSLCLQYAGRIDNQICPLMQ